MVTPLSDAQTYDVLEPATGEVIRPVSEDSPETVGRAVAAASDAAPAWRALGPLGRAAILREFAGAVGAEVESLAALDSRNGGFPIRAARIGAAKGVEALEYFCGLAPLLTGQTIPASQDHLHYTVREPFGVTGVMTAYNHPTLFAMARTAATLVAGNAAILKPAVQTPLSAMRIAEIAEQHLPAGVFQVVTGGAETGNALVKDPRVRRIAFTGSVDTALRIQEAAARSGVIKRLSFQLGGKNPLIVLPDADLERAVDGAIEGMNLTRVTGQSCGSTSRAFVHRDLYTQFVEGVAARFRALRFGWPHEEETVVGPLISDTHRDRIAGFVELGRSEGARLVTGGLLPGAPFDRGFYYPPTLFDDVEPSMRIAQQEIFGPVLTAMSWSDERQMLAAVNSVRFGLTASIYTNDVRSAHRLAAAVEAGYVWVNTVERRWIGVPFGGFKDSGTSLEYSSDELFAHSQVKSVSVALT